MLGGNCRKSDAQAGISRNPIGSPDDTFCGTPYHTIHYKALYAVRYRTQRSGFLQVECRNAIVFRVLHGAQEALYVLFTTCMSHSLLSYDAVFFILPHAIMYFTKYFIQYVMEVKSMFAINTAPATRVRDNFKEYCTEVRTGGKALIVTRHDTPEVVILSVKDYNALMNRLYLDKLNVSLTQIDRGEGVRLTSEELEAL